jgi:hypothetical protein
LIVDALNAGDVDYVIVGGFALAAHGVVRATDDVDLVPEPSRENLDRLMATLALLDAAPADPNCRSLRTCGGDAHVLDRVATAPGYADLRTRAEVVDIAGAPAPVCSLADLRSTKLASGRPRDVVDVAELDELNRR